MKRIFLILTASLTLGASSCTKYLDQVPDDVITVDDIFKSKANTDKFLANIYYFLPNELSQRLHEERAGHWTGASDEADYNWSFNYANNINLSVWSNTDGNAAVYWTDFYKAIRNATYFIQNIDNANPDEVTTVMKSRFKAEAKAIRALYYFYLIRIYGPVILLNDELVDFDQPTTALKYSRSSMEECVNFIVSELDAAAVDLPTDPVNSEWGRITKGIAKAYKVEALLLGASPLWNGNTDYANMVNKDGKQLVSQTVDVTKWTAAATAAKQFIDEFVPTTYDLYKVSNADPFQAAYLSCRNVATEDWNKEWIFARSNSMSRLRYDKTPKHVGFPAAQQGAGALGATQKIVDAYFMANGLPISDVNSGYVNSGFSDFKAPFDVANRRTYNQWIGREPRFYVGITYNNSYWLYQDNSATAIVSVLELSGNSGRSQSTSDVSPSGYIIRKNVATNGNNHAALMLRLANIYLDYAEALNESNYTANLTETLKYINLIRSRAGIPQYGTGTGSIAVPASQAAMRDAIRAERRVELAFENVRYFDTRRWKIAATTDAGAFYGLNMNGNGIDFYTPTVFETRVFRARDYLFPIPNNQVLLNENLVQNPGWGN